MKQQRIAAMLLMLALPMLFSACRPAEQEAGTQDTVTMLTGVYEKTAVELDETVTYVRNMTVKDEKICMYTTMGAGEERVGTVLILDTNDDSIVYETIPDMDYASGFAAGEDGYMFLISEFDKEKFTETYTLNYVEGDAVLWSKQLSDFISYEYLWNMPSVVCRDGTWYIGANTTLALVSAEGTLLGTQMLPSEVYDVFMQNGDVHVWGYNFHYKVDASASGTLTEDAGWTEALGQVPGGKIYTGDGYDFYYIGNESLVGCRVAEGDEPMETVGLLNWVNCGILPDQIRGMAIVSPETVYLYGSDGLGGENALWKCTAAADRELDCEVIRISYSENGSNKIPLAAVQFNNLQNEYQIVCEEYGSDGGYSTVMDGLDAAILQGEVGDILMFDSMEDMAKYADKGLLCDLYTLMDDEFSADDIFGCVRDVSEIGGRLYGLPREFEVSIFSAKTEHLPEKAVWNVETYLETARNLPDGMCFTEYDSQEFMTAQMMYILSEWVDMETHTCHFDEGSFAAYLEYLASLPETDETAYDTEENLFAADKILMYGYAVNNYATYAMMECVFGEGEDVTMIGFPSSSGTACVLEGDAYFSIRESSEGKDGAMAFLRYLFSEECMIDERRGMRKIPSLKSTMKAWEEIEGENYYYIYTDRLGSYSGGPELTTQEQEGRPGVSVKVTDFMEEFYTFLDTVHAYRYVPSMVGEIVMEEVSVYLGTGKSAADCADAIQSRVSIWLSEHE